MQALKSKHKLYIKIVPFYNIFLLPSTSKSYTPPSEGLILIVDANLSQVLYSKYDFTRQNNCEQFTQTRVPELLKPQLL